MRPALLSLSRSLSRSLFPSLRVVRPALGPCNLAGL